MFSPKNFREHSRQITYPVAQRRSQIVASRVDAQDADQRPEPQGSQHSAGDVDRKTVGVSMYLMDSPKIISHTQRKLLTLPARFDILLVSKLRKG